MADTPDTEFHGHVYEIVLKTEASPERFERFCAAAIGQIEGGLPIYTTTPSWDLGRDAVGFGKAAGIYVCSSLRDDPDEKTLQDLERLQDTTKAISTVYFCSSQRLSEHQLNKIQVALEREIDHKYPVRCLGGYQLAQAMMAPNSELKRFYKAEIANCIKAVDTSTDSESDATGLRLALMTSGSEDSIGIRKAIYEAAVLDMLALEKRTEDSLCIALSNSLKLSRPIQSRVLLPFIRDLLGQGLVREDGGIYAITEAGHQRRAENETSAAEQLMDGRLRIQRALEVSIGAPLIPDDFARIWSAFEEKLAHFLYQRGASIVDEVSAMIDPDEDLAASSHSLSFVDEMADAVGKTSSSIQRQIALSQAVKDLFSDRTGPAADWLVQVCAGFVAACTMGLEAESARAVGNLLAHTTIVLDTDVILSLLGFGEPEHDAVRAIVDAWHKNKGRILVGQPALEEAAYHAWIAQSDFNQVTHLLPGTREDRLRVIENAFVRSFAELLANKKIKHKGWRSYILNYRGESQYDHSRIASALRGDFNINIMPPRSSHLADLAIQVQRYALGLAEQNHPTSLSKADVDKATRDAELYTAFIHLATSTREMDPHSSCLLISSGHRLARIESHFKQTGERRMVISIASALLLVSFLPDVSLGLTAMKAFLFDERRLRFSTELERSLVRMVKSSQEVSLPWAQRGALMREMRQRLIENARSEGIKKSEASLSEIERDALRPQNRENTIKMLRDSLDALAIDSRVERENQDLRAEVSRLKEKLARVNAPDTRKRKR